MQDDIIPYLAVKLQDTSYRLTITGHSMVRSDSYLVTCTTHQALTSESFPFFEKGASAASICATVLRSQGLSLNAYTYGQPRTGNQAYANYVDSLFPFISPSQETNKMLRVTHANDGIAQVPSRRRNYHHHSTEIWIPPTEDKMYRCVGQEPGDCNAGVFGFPLNSPHFSYFGISTGNSLDQDAACKGSEH